MKNYPSDLITTHFHQLSFYQGYLLFGGSNSCSTLNVFSAMSYPILSPTLQQRMLTKNPMWHKLLQ